MVGILGFFFLWYYFYRHRKGKRVAPSEEFKKYRRRSVPLADAEGGGAAEAADRVVGQRWSVDGQHALHDDGGEKPEGDNTTGAPPVFALGLFKDPIFEKGVAICLANQRGIQCATREFNR